MENFDTTSNQYDGAINEYLDSNKDNQFNLETTAIAASRVFAISQSPEALVLAKKNPSIIKMWDLFQKNNELQKANIDQIIEVQKASHAFIQLINKRDMLQAAAIITVKNQLNTLNIENQEIYNTIKKLAGNVLDRFNQLERHIEHVEAVASLTQWIQNLKWRKYNEDPHTKRFFRILEDFYFKSGKNFTMQNLESLKTALDQSEINPFDTITISDFTTTLVDELIEHDFNESMKHSPYNNKHSFDDINEKISLPFLSSLYLLSEEYNHLTKRRYPVDKIRDDIKQAALCYLKKDCGIDVEAQLEYYHLGIELLNGRRLIEFLDSPATTTTKETAKKSPSASPIEIDASQERYKEYMDIVAALMNDEETPGVIDDEEREMLKMKQKILKLTDEEVKKIEESVINNHQNKDEAEKKYREEVKNALGDNPEITAKKRMRLDLSAQSFGISPDIAKKCEADIVEEINKNISHKMEEYRTLVRKKTEDTYEISPKARIFLDLKIQELGLSKELAKICENEVLAVIEQEASTDVVKTAELYRIKAERGDKEAQYNLGNCYNEGKGVEEDHNEAIKWYQKAAEQGHADAQNILGYCYSKGIGVEENLSTAVQYYRKASEEGHIQAQVNLGNCYLEGRGIDENENEAIKWFLKAAEQGHADAQYYLGLCSAEDKSEAQKWFSKAAGQGHADAQYALGLLLGPCLDSAKWFRKAADQEHADAQYELGSYYAFGLGVEMDDNEALKWYRKAAVQGHPKAQHELGDCYLHGIAVSEDKKEAIKWYHKAAEQGLADSQRMLGILAETVAEKNKWFQKIIERSEIIPTLNYEWGIKWGFLDDDIWIKNSSYKNWDQSDHFLEVTIKFKNTNSAVFHTLLKVPTLNANETHLFEDAMSISDGSDKKHEGEAVLYRLNK